ncbi:hypothetical protein LF817_13275 [Halobacillus sp. A1]|uniref:hypothetical protein n=1 Tax=Halobacillus sp. A1 TaxID=2880262 RepID=UPI0020A63D4C|nr:hypothetical protein [Halobacillus sp. A1]MCP3032313.1 hypothetical protein [Halobacillus sp. A1]
MNIFLKINLFSILNAFVLFLAVELGLNVYEISDLFSLNQDVVMKLVTVLYIIGFIIFSFLLFKVVKKWMDKRKSSFWSIILWLPYFILFNFIFANLFPVNYPGHEPGAGAGFAMMFAVFIYPFYLLIINVLGTGAGIKED